jgi:gliding motility associated protien GldN
MTKNIILLFCACFSFAHAQLPQPDTSKRPVPKPYIRQADVGWSKRIWRVIDLREKLNHPLYFPVYPNAFAVSLFDILKQGTMSGKISAYNPNDDDMATKFSIAELKNKLVKNDTAIFYESDIGGIEHEVKTIINDTVQAADVLQYYVKEDWYFDTQRSVLDVFIIGICPVKYDKEKDLYVPLFWVYFNECRSSLASYSAINPYNDAQRISYDDVFTKRMFNSMIYKESNVYDRAIAEYLKGSDCVLESERIKEGIFNFESDFWHY